MTFVPNKKDFQQSLSDLGRIEDAGYYFLQYIEDNEVSEYASISIEGKGFEFHERIKFIGEFYGLLHACESKR